MESPRDRIRSAQLYLCTDARRERGDLADFAEAALSGGVDIIQLRDKGSVGEKQFGPMEAQDELAALAVLSAAAHRHGALLAVNDRADIALAARADVLHLGQRDLPVHYARSIVGKDTVIGRSTHDAHQAEFAAHEPDIDYFCVGPCWSTPTKPGRTPAGLGLVCVARDIETERPWFAIGGIDETRVSQVVGHGAQRIVVVRAITEADDPHAAARRLKTQLPAL
ncbi:thiamine phosphate synthase [Hoyosella rhizosphaerae]|uniref:Thiamine-phosphate synthase n=1 Tax=Hoyosella rhizosphaerae TaxID=1755582 RepID=A0A916U6M0_9ACTN|nr:thiamine phosphate synthase [Hoyosella rhizosphaerae]MBN4927760.1 thiamine phosphate synthase [Hoyosella rhizosphaerae]GGC61746.1 thiamine-phosphate synthase [Hoyosella rhizosphaerae]